MSLRTRNILAICFLILVFFRPVGYLTQDWKMVQIGWNYLISPLPIPFNDIGPHENYTQTREYFITLRSGEEVHLDELRGETVAFTGPHRHKIALMGPFIYGAITPPSVRSVFYDYIACSDNAYRSYDIQSFSLVQTDKRTGKVIEFYHSCEE